MSATNSKALSATAGILEVAQWSATVPTLLADSSNAAAVKAAADALSFVRLASITDLKIGQNFGSNKVEVITDDNGTIYQSAVPEVKVDGNWFEVLEPTAINAITGQDSLAVAASPVTVVAEAHGTGWVVGKPIMVTNKNGANTTVTSIVVKSGASTLTVVTDYSSYVGDGVNGLLGYTYIVPVTAQAGAITFGYSYTPNASTYIGAVIKNTEMPKLIVRITATNDAGKKVIAYLIDAGFDGELVNQFVDVARAGNLGSTAFSFLGNRNGQVLIYTDNV